MRKETERDRHTEVIALSTTYVLLALMAGEKYGMELWKEIRCMTNDVAGGRTPNNMYNILERCLKHGFIEITGYCKNSGGTGNTYRLTDIGREHLEEVVQLSAQINRDYAELSAQFPRTTG